MKDHKRHCKVIKFVSAGLVDEEGGHNYGMDRETEGRLRDRCILRKQGEGANRYFVLNFNPCMFYYWFYNSLMKTLS